MFTSKCAFRHSGNVATSNLQKVLRGLQFFNIFTSKCAFRHSGNVATSNLQKVLRGLQFFNVFTSKCVFFFTFSLQNAFFATAAYSFSTSELQKVLPPWGVLSMFTSKCVFRHSGVHFFDIWTYKSAPTMRCFEHVHFKMCFSPQRRAFFRHLNLQKCSHHEVFWACSLQNAFFATAACIFSTSELTKVLRTRHVLHIFTSKCAFRHSGVQFFISPLSTYLCTRRFNRPTFRLTRHTNHWKNTAFRDFSNIWRGCIFFLLTFALLHLLPSDLTTLLCFSTVHIVGSFYLNFLRSEVKICNVIHTHDFFFGRIAAAARSRSQRSPAWCDGRPPRVRTRPWRGRRCLISHVAQGIKPGTEWKAMSCRWFLGGTGAVGGDEDCWKVMESLHYGPNTIPSIQWCLTILTLIFRCHPYGHYGLSPPSALQGPARACMA